MCASAAARNKKSDQWSLTNDHWFRRLVVRYEFHAENFLGMVLLACMKIVLRYING